jgi:two-component system, chemotaxis family, protein-glutamate methylesterase/glutaminase
VTVRASFARRPSDRAAEPPLRVMIVDDSTVARAVLSRMIASHEGFEIAALASSAQEALEALRSVRVDIILLDVEMPGESGIEALPEIIRKGRGARVLIVSSMAEDGAEVTVKALALGAADTLPKPGVGNFAGRFSTVLADRLRRIGAATREPAGEAAPGEDGPLRLIEMSDGPVACVALAASTGGLHALFEFLRPLPRKIGAPILVTQHLPSIFMVHFARQLANASGRKAVVVDDGDSIEDDVIHVAPGDAHLCLARAADGIRVKLDRRRVASGCLPSADPMLESVAEIFGAGGVGVMLSGMGRDGLAGARRIVDSGGAMLAQDRRSAAIWGMPRGVAEAGLASAVMPPADLARRIAQRMETDKWK